MWIWSTIDFPDLTLSTFTYTTTCLLVNRVYKTFYLLFVVVVFNYILKGTFEGEKFEWVVLKSVWHLWDCWRLKIVGSTSSYGLFVLFLPSLVNRMHCANRIKIRYISVLFVAKEWLYVNERVLKILFSMHFDVIRTTITWRKKTWVLILHHLISPFFLQICYKLYFIFYNALAYCMMMCSNKVNEGKKIKSQNGKRRSFKHKKKCFLPIKFDISHTHTRIMFSIGTF